ncbi:MAG: 2OG-Fe(II) oxygenase [Bacilli bacterium]
MNMLSAEQHLFPHMGNVIHTSDRDVRVVARFEEPLVVVLDNVLSKEECEHIIELASEQMKRSKVGSSRDTSSIRNSSSTFLPEHGSANVLTIEKRVAEIMGIPYSHGEGLQILNYAIGQEYKAHHDYFKAGSKAAANPRISTLVMYLSDVEEGGETYFPHLKLSVKPQQGMAVYFEYFYDSEALNEQTLHGSAPVVVGNKWAATQWMRRQATK